MLNKLKQQIQYAAIAAPVYAQETLKIESKTQDFKPLGNLTAAGIISGAVSLVLIVVALVFFWW